MSKITRIFTGTVYPDAENYNCDDVLFKVLQQPESAYILHDKDDVKSHIHFLFRLPQPTTPHKVAVLLGLPENVIECGRSFPALVRYLIHLDDPDKYQYSPDDVQTETIDLQSYFSANKSEKSLDDGLFVLDLLKHFEGSYPSRRSVIEYVVANGDYNAFRRNYNILKDVLF